MSSDFSPVSPSGFETELGKLADGSDLDAHAALDAEADDAHGAETYADKVASEITTRALWVGPQELALIQNTSLDTNNLELGVLLPESGSNPQVMFSRRVALRSWTTAEVAVYWVADGTGDVEWDLRVRNFGEGSTGGSSGGGIGQTVDASADGTIQTTVLGSFSWEAEVSTVRVQRLPSGGNDTLAATVRLLGIELRDAS